MKIILAEDVSYDDAVAACRSQLLYLPKVGRLGDTWCDIRGLPRMAVVNIEHETQYAWLLDDYGKSKPLGEFLAQINEKYET